MKVNSAKAKTIFLEAVEQHAPSEWSTFLDQACGKDADLRRQVEILLDAHARMGTFLEQGAIHPEATVDTAPVTEKPGMVIGNYQLVEQIGEGGMGLAEKAKQAAVLQAEQARTAELEARIDALVEQAQRLGTGPYPDFPRAIQLLSEAIEQRPGQTKLYLYRGSACCELGRFSEAMVDLEKALELQPRNNPAGHWLAAVAAGELGDVEKSRRHQESASRDDADSPEAVVVQALAMPYDQRGVDLLTEAIGQQPFEPAFHFYRSRIAYNLAVRKGNRRFYRLAVEDLERSLLGRPTDRRIVEMLCRCLVVLDRMAESHEQALSRAKELLDQWSETEPDDIRALAMRAVWLARGEETEAAMEVARQGMVSGSYAPRPSAARVTPG
ncbi:MAG: tetratricopeptide repeat protein, partial [Pirellulales bacterium]